MLSTRHHAEWLSLIEVSGPFLTMPVLEKVFPQGLDAHDADGHRNLRLAFEEWEERPENPALHRAWIKYVLQQMLGLPDEVLAEGQAIPETIKATVAEHSETLRPDLLIRNPADGEPAHQPRLLMQIYPADQDLNKPIAGRHWKASPATRMMELLHAADVKLGLITNGERWMMVYAPRGETTGFASWYASLWVEEKLTLQAFVSLLGVRRFFASPENETLDAMLAESATHQQEVTDQLGLQVRRAIEVLIRSLDRADQDHGRALLAKVSEAVIYESAVTVMMRLVILFCAEERRLLLLGDPLYDQNYAVSMLVAQLQEAADNHGEEVLERRLDAWARLLSTFRVVFGGIEHEQMRLPAYGGRLFDPDRFPFLEGRANSTKWRETPANPLPINNRTVLHLLRSLQYLEMHGEAQRLSFSALGIEQIGHVYEGLLDHTVKRATEPVLSLAGAKGSEPEVALAELERRRAKGKAELLKFLKQQTGRSENTLQRALETEPETGEVNRLRAACGNNDDLFRRIRPFAALVCQDSFGRPIVIHKGSVYVTAGTDRRSTATHYTQVSLTEPIVRYTLEPLVFIGPAEGKPVEEWQLRSPRELLGLRICDMACGSGAFLVQACRYLSELLVEAWERAVSQHPGAPGITPEGAPSTGAAGESLIPAEAEERMTYARRLVVQRCLYGVDKNPLAVEMAKLSLWLLTLAKDQPFTFLDANIRCGDSPIGIYHLDQLRYFTLDLKGAQQLRFNESVIARLDEVIALHKKIAAHPARTAAEAQVQEQWQREAEEKTAPLRCAADLLVSVGLQKVKARAIESMFGAMAMKANDYVENHTPEDLEETARQALNRQMTFHWPLEFPGVFKEQGGFDAIVCNPPFIGGQKITGILGVEYRNFLVDHLANGRKGSADLSAYFFLQAQRLLRSGDNFDPGHFGMLATNTIAQGDTREVGLDQIVAGGGIIYRAVPSRPWPGAASLEVAEVWLRNGGKWRGQFLLEGKPVPGITPFLTKPGRATGKPYRLAANADKSFQGSIVLGMGFVLTPEEAQALIVKDKHNRDVLFPYLNGEDLNSRPDQSPSRWVINFKDWPLERSAKGSWFKADEGQIKLWLQNGRVPKDYPEPVAADYPDCLRVVEENVKPERTRKKSNGEFQLRYPLYLKWWIYGEKRPALYATISNLSRVLICSEVTKYLAFAFSPIDIVYSANADVLTPPTESNFAILQSDLHEAWARAYSSQLETRLKYSPGNAFETFPFPEETDALEKIGERYYSHRQSTMLTRREGLTKTYNCFHDPEESAADIERMRELHQQMDEAVAHSYGWTSLRLGHDFHETKQGLRFTISEEARREVLDRLLELNHCRYAEEVAAGLHDKNGKAKKAAAGRTRPAATPSLFGEEENEGKPAPPARAQSFERNGHGRLNHLAQEYERPTPIGELETNAVMAAFRQALRGRGWMGRDELLKEVSLALGYQRLREETEEPLRNHLRAAIRRGIAATDGPERVGAATRTMEDYSLEELREVFASVMRLARRYEREDVVRAVAEHLGFSKLTETVRQPIKSAINSGIRQGVLGYEGEIIWREM